MAIGKNNPNPRRHVEILYCRFWRNHGIEEATWEVEEEIRKKYPELFINRGMNFEDEILFKRGRM